MVRLDIFVFFSLLHGTVYVLDASSVHVDMHKRCLAGFMTEKQYLSCLHYQMLTEGGSVVPMPVPIVLPVTDDVKANIEGKGSIALKNASGEVTAFWMKVRFAEIW